MVNILSTTTPGESQYPKVYLKKKKNEEMDYMLK